MINRRINTASNKNSNYIDNKMREGVEENLITGISTANDNEHDGSNNNISSSGGEYVGLNAPSSRRMEQEEQPSAATGGGGSGNSSSSFRSSSFPFSINSRHDKSTMTKIVWTFIQVAAFLVVLSICYEHFKAFAVFVALGIFLVAKFGVYSITNNTYGYQQAPAATNDNDLEHRLMMDRINREREESEAMVAEAAKMMLEINKQHLEEFITTNPSSTYEQWIKELHPDNVKEDGGDIENGNGNIVIDHRFYVEDSDHRILWNENSNGEERKYVSAKKSSNSNSSSSSSDGVVF